jgi:hypothetical protein
MNTNSSANSKNSKGRSRNIGKTLKAIVSGIIINDRELPLLRIIYFGFVLGLIYIANSFYAIKTFRQINAVERELKELKYEYINAQSAFTDSTKQSRIIRRAAQLGLHESMAPPQKITVDRKELEELKQ